MYDLDSFSFFIFIFFPFSSSPVFSPAFRFRSVSVSAFFIARVRLVTCVLPEQVYSYMHGKRSSHAHALFLSDVER